MPKIITPIIKLEFKTYHILNQSAMIMGPTKSGKSRTTLFLAELIRDCVDFVTVFCPTNNINHDWDGIVPQCTIIKTLNDDNLNTVIDVQIKKCEYIDLANESEQCQQFWRELPGYSEIDRKYENKIRDIEEAAEKNKKTMSNEDFDRVAYEKEKALIDRDHESRELIMKYTKGLFRKYGVTHKDTTEIAIQLRTFSHYFRLNKQMLLVIDDCTDLLPQVTGDTWTRLFQKNRWFRITILMNVHTIGHIKHQSLRQGPFWFIFANSTMAQFFLDNKNCGMKNQICPDSNSLIDAFKHDKEKKTMQKVAINREQMYIAKFTFSLDMSFKLGTSVLWEYDVIKERQKKEQGTRRIDLRMI